MNQIGDTEMRKPMAKIYQGKSRGRMARRKGHQFEREIAIALRLVYPDARRHLEYQDAEANGVDLTNTGHLKIQCKRGRKWSSLSAIEEVQADELMGEIPVLITQGDNKRVLVALPLEEFIRMLRAQTPVESTGD